MGGLVNGYIKLIGVTCREAYVLHGARLSLAYWLTKFAGVTQRQAARVLGMTNREAVSMQLRRLWRAVKTERHLQRQLAAGVVHFLSFKG
jgi:hypothetical protein